MIGLMTDWDTAAWPAAAAKEAIEAEALRCMAKIYPRRDDLKEGGARPSLNSLEVIRLLEAG